MFGLGSRAYPHFCAFAHSCRNLIVGLGGEEIFPIGEGDELCGQEDSFMSWAKDVFKVFNLNFFVFIHLINLLLVIETRVCIAVEAIKVLLTRKALQVLSCSSSQGGCLSDMIKKGASIKTIIYNQRSKNKIQYNINNENAFKNVVQNYRDQFYMRNMLNTFYHYH